MNPGIARLAIVVALVVAGIAVLARGFADAESVAAPPDGTPTSPTPTATPTPSQTPDQDIVPNQEGVLVQVFNGTSAPGLAADFQTLLTQEGGYLAAGDPGDAPDKPILDTIVYFVRDQNRQQNRADAGLLSDEFLSGAPVEPLPQEYAEIVDEAADVVVVLGEDQAGEA